MPSDSILDIIEAAAELIAEPVVESALGPFDRSAESVRETPSATKRRTSPTNTDVPSLWYIEVDSPIGQLVVVSEDGAIVGLYMESHRHGPVNRDSWMPDVNGVRNELNEARKQLVEYFDGKRVHFDLRLRARGTDVQHMVWRALQNIPFGETRSYGEIATSIGKPNASRAVGAANGRNPISIIVPCHRVIGSNGSLTGFGGGLERKEWLLTHEARVSGKHSKYVRHDLFSGASEP